MSWREWENGVATTFELTEQGSRRPLVAVKMSQDDWERYIREKYGCTVYGKGL